MNIDNQSTNSKDRETTEYRVLPILVSFLIAGFIGLFSETALNMALNSLIGDFGIQETTVQWLTTGYLLTLGILVPVSGLILQWFSTRQLFIAFTRFSIIGTFIAAISPTFAFLMVARVVQAIGTALMLPLMFNTILLIVPPHKRGKIMGLLGLVIMFAPALDQPFQVLFLNSFLALDLLVFITFFIIALIYGFYFMQNVSTLTKPKIDVLSIILSTVGFGGIVFGFSSTGEGGWGALLLLFHFLLVLWLY